MTKWTPPLTKKGAPCKRCTTLQAPCPWHKGQAKGKPKGGRPQKINPDLLQRISRAIKAGSPPEAASAHVGIHKSTYYDWSRRGAQVLEEYAWSITAVPAKHPDRVFAEFSDVITKALADWEVGANALISKAAQGERDAEGKWIQAPSWQAKAWQLERRAPERYARTTRLEHEGSVPVHGRLTVEDLREAYRVVKKDAE